MKKRPDMVKTTVLLPVEAKAKLSRLKADLRERGRKETESDILALLILAASADTIGRRRS
jgi:hypothetical protein